MLHSQQLNLRLGLNTLVAEHLNVDRLSTSSFSSWYLGRLRPMSTLLMLSYIDCLT
jgi:hypothetical protein